MKKNLTGLWNNLTFQPLGNEQVDVGARSIGLLPLVQDLLTKASGYVTEYRAEGCINQINDDLDQNEFEAKSVYDILHDHISKLGGRILYKYLYQDSSENITYIWPDSIVDLNVANNYVVINAISQNEEFCQELKKFFDDQWAPIEKVGSIYAIVRQGMGLSLSSIGNAGVPLEEGNYSKKVIEDYRYVIDDLQSKTPSGRITIMRGPAGSGKSHIIRAMLLEVPDAMFVLVSPEVVTDLTGPELLPLLMQYHGSSTGPIILVLEDADHCLVKRDANNISLIQGLLNLGDGILGSLLDIRIVATTNADELNLDKAIIRPGRLSKMLDVDELDYDTIYNILTRLLPGVEFTIPCKCNPIRMALAEVYALARLYGWKPVSRKVEENNRNSCKAEY